VESALGLLGAVEVQHLRGGDPALLVVDFRLDDAVSLRETGRGISEHSEDDKLPHGFEKKKV